MAFTKRSSRTVAARIHKLSGQLSAIDGMVIAKRPCTDVLAQLEAVRAGLASVAAIIVNEELMRMLRRRNVEPSSIVRLTRTFIEKT
jgi:DNA-binding FrmR family transcriptional regulator